MTVIYKTKDGSTLRGKTAIRPASCYEIHYAGSRTRIDPLPSETFEQCRARMLEWIVERAKENRQRTSDINAEPTIYIGPFLPGAMDKLFEDHLQEQVLLNLHREATTPGRANANARASVLGILAKHYGLVPIEAKR